MSKLDVEMDQAIRVMNQIVKSPIKLAIPQPRVVTIALKSVGVVLVWNSNVNIVGRNF